MRIASFVLYESVQQRLLREAYQVALQSPDPSTQNGALVFEVQNTSLQSELILIGEGYNKVPRGLGVTPERLNDRWMKLKYTGHAEWHATIAAQRKRALFDFLGPTLLVCPWACCTECAKYIGETGVTHVLAHKQALDKTPKNSEWARDIPIAHSQLAEKGIQLILFNGQVDGPTIRFGGEDWKP